MSLNEWGRLLLVVGALGLGTADAFAQTQGRQIVTGFAPLLADKYLNCGWSFWWDPPDGFADLDVEIHALGAGISNYRTGGTGIGGGTTLYVTLKATYLPSTTYGCASDGAILWPGWFGAYGWESVPREWNNPDCDGYAPLLYGSHPTSPYWISEELYNTSSLLVGAVEAGSYYWGSIGNELGYSSLQTPNGGDVGFYPRADLPPDEPGAFYPSTRTIGLNTVHFSTWGHDKWAVIAAHELGHAVGFDHATGGDSSTTIMRGSTLGGQEGLLPRTLDKCAPVKAFPVDLRS